MMHTFWKRTADSLLFGAAWLFATAVYCTLREVEPTIDRLIGVSLIASLAGLVIIICRDLAEQKRGRS